MPSKTRYTKRRVVRRRRRTRPNIKQNYRPNIGNMTLRQAAYGAMKGVNMIRGLVNSELKKFDVINTATITAVPTIQCITEVPVGDTDQNRNGNSILGKYVNIHYKVTANGAIPATSVRVMLICDTMNQGVAPTSADIFQFGASGTAFVLSPLDHNNTDRFTTLFTDVLNFTNTGILQTVRKHFIPLDFHLRYNTANAFEKNSLWMIIVADTTASPPVITYTSRFTYYDN